MASEGFDDTVAAVLAAGRILVEADDTSLRKELVELLLHLFRTAAKKFNVFAAAGRADRRHGLFGITVVTFQMRRLAVIDHGYVTGIAFDDVAALAAHDERRIAPPVEEDDCLLTGCQGFIQQSVQGIGHDAVIAAGQFLPHIDNSDFRQGAWPTRSFSSTKT